MVKKAFLKTFLELETAETEDKRRKGLQGRTELSQYIPLDIIFLSESGEVLNIEQGEPQSTDHIFSDGDCRHFLELKQGKAKDFNISEGDNLSFLLN